MSTHASFPERPIRVGIFDSVRQADIAVEQLLSAGFTKEQITVICSERAIQKHFAEYEHQDPAGSKTPAAALAGGSTGAALAALATLGLASLTTLGGAALVAAGGVAMWGGGVAGGLIGAMMTRGVEKELANYYDQAVERGKILVAAEQEDPKRRNMLAIAEEIFAEHGVEPLSLREG
jgi:hypothetical protein